MSRAPDPAVFDPEAKDRADRAKHMLTRLEAAKPRLQALLDKAVATEKLAAWKADLAKLVAIRPNFSLGTRITA
jgi:hypothetical protein